MSTLTVVPTTSLARHVLAAYLNWVAENKELIRTYLICEFKEIDAPDWLEESAGNDGTIVLNISAEAVRQFRTLPTGIQFEARFKGVPTQITVPWHAMELVYAININGDIQAPVNLAGITAAEVAIERSQKNMYKLQQLGRAVYAWLSSSSFEFLGALIALMGLIYLAGWGVWNYIDNLHFYM